MCAMHLTFNLWPHYLAKGTLLLLSMLKWHFGTLHEPLPSLKSIKVTDQQHQQGDDNL